MSELDIASQCLGVILGLTAAILLVKEDILTWPAGIAFNLISLCILYNARLYANVLLYIILLLINIYGWIHWHRSQQQTEDGIMKITCMRYKDYIIYTCFVLLSTYILGHTFTQQGAQLPYTDSFGAALSALALYATSLKKLEAWIIWIIADIVYIYVYLTTGLYWYSLLPLLLIIISLTGWVKWKKSIRAYQKETAKINEAT